MIELNLKEKWIDQMYGGALTTWCLWIEHAIETIRSKDEKEIEINNIRSPIPDKNELRKSNSLTGVTTVRCFYPVLPNMNKNMLSALKEILNRHHINIVLSDCNPNKLTIRIY